MTNTSSSASAGPANTAGAVAALSVLPDMTAAHLSGVLLVSGQTEPEVTQLQPTQRSSPVLVDVATAASNKYRECEVIEYGPAASTVGDQVMWMNLNDVPLLRVVLEDSEDLANLAQFDPGKTKMADIRMVAIRTEILGTAAVFVQALRGGQVVARSSRFGVLVKKGVIDVPKEQILLLTTEVTAVVFENYVFFSDRAAFQRLFQLIAELQAQATATFQEITADLRIQGLETMLAAVTGHPSMLGKMASIQRKIDQYPQYKRAMTMANLLKFAREHPEYRVELSGDGDGAELVFRNDPQHRFKILKLLDDDHLRSELTTLEYEVNSKGLPVG